jgi:hypothetical protein
MAGDGRLQGGGGVTRVRLKSAHDISDKKLAELLNTKYGTCFMECFSMKNNKNNFIARCTSNESERLHSTEMTKKLKKDGIEVVVTPEAKARRTIICNNVSLAITENEPADIIEEIQNKNTWAKINHVYAFNNGKKLKIEFSEEAGANKAMDIGIKAFHLIIPAFNISRDIYIPIIQCRNCYLLGHDTRKCESTDLTCSECAKSGHRYNDCKAKKKKCVLCNEEHSAMNIKCNAKREYIKKIRRDKEYELRKAKQYLQTTIQPGKSFADAAKYTTSTTTKQTVNSAYNLGLENNKVEIQITSCIIMAHMSSNGNINTFNEHLSELMTLNELPTIKIEEKHMPSSNLLNITKRSIHATKKIVLKPNTKDTIKTNSPIKRQHSPEDRPVKKRNNSEPSQQDGAVGEQEQGDFYSSSSEEEMGEEEEMEEEEAPQGEEEQLEGSVPPKLTEMEASSEKTEKTQKTKQDEAQSTLDGRRYDIVLKLKKRMKELTHTQAVEMYDNKELELVYDKTKTKNMSHKVIEKFFREDRIKGARLAQPPETPKLQRKNSR